MYESEMGSKNIPGISWLKNITKKKDDEALVTDEDKVDYTKDENVERGNWSGKLDFLLACLGYAVGLGNVWRFPYLCYKNGGAVFFIPYVIMLFFVGMPIFFFELSLGQFTSSSPTTCWMMAPFFKGVGVGMVLLSAIVAIYYNMIIAWALWYFFATLVNIRGGLPWAKCDGYYNTPFCSERLAGNLTQSSCIDLGFEANSNGVCYNTSAANSTMEYVYGLWNTTLAGEHGIAPVLSTEEYLNGRALGKYYSDGIENIGPVRWELFLCLLACWIIACLSMIRGVKSSGKVVYFTATFPYVVLTILLVRGATLEGHAEGVAFYVLKADTSKLAEAQVWRDAASQIFFSLSASWGGLIALASYNRFHNDCLRDSLIVSIGNCLTSFYAGFVIFSFLGFLAHKLNKSVEDVAESGVGLAFIVYPDAVTRMAASELWAVLFFFMLITLGLDSEFALIETVSTSMFDEFPQLRTKKPQTMLVLSVLMFICGLPLCCDGGAFVLQLMDYYAGAWNVLILALFECICIAYVYTFNGGGGWKRWREDIRAMLGENNCWSWDYFYFWWAACWFVFTPIGVLFVLIFNWVDYKEVTYGSYEYPTWAAGIGWVLTWCSAAPPFIVGLIMIILQLRKGKPVADIFRPTPEWGPALVKHRKLILRYVPETNFVVDPWGKGEQEESGQTRPGGGSNPNSVGSVPGASSASIKQPSLGGGGSMKSQPSAQAEDIV